MKKTKIVCTLGPASASPEIFTEMVHSGLNVARLNFSHGSYESHGDNIQMIKTVRSELKVPVAILLDTKGPEIRTGNFKDGKVLLKTGDKFTLSTRDLDGDASICSVSYKNLPNEVEIGCRILIDDGLIELKVLEIKDGTEIVCEILNGGEVSNYKGVNVPYVDINMPSVTEEDIKDIKFGIKHEIDFLAASFIRCADDVFAVRKVLEENDGDSIQVISKIENAKGVKNIDEIIELSDGIMIARGDLGVEIPMEEVPIVQKEIIRKCNLAGKPVITATQMLDSMIRNPRPTRAEATDIANAIYDGTDAIMLSGETASGKYPVEAVKTMAKIAKNAEKNLDYENMYLKRKNASDKDVTFAVSHATVTTANDLNASVILTATSSGFTARKISALRPKANIVAACSKNSVRRKLSLIWGVTSIDTINHDNIEQIFARSLETAMQKNLIKAGEILVFTAGVPVGVAGATNLMRVHLVGDILLKGIGLGNKVVSGKVKFVKEPERAEELIEHGDIMVCRMTDRTMIPVMERLLGMIVLDGGFTSHAAISAINMKIPSVVGVPDAFDVLEDGQVVTLDSAKGIVYNGKTRVL
ncbi:MAG: pyruvate kinase [Bacillota bacterium]|nr:pyruvate kinase [Bacillota bacterium]